MAGKPGSFWKSVGKSLEAVVSKLPFDRLTAHQAFDLAFDTVMLVAMFLALRSDLSGDRKLALPFCCLLLMAWSFWLNSPPRRHPTSRFRTRRQSP
jgi:hypothetical protein